jgi:hypothetical protein
MSFHTVFNKRYFQFLCTITILFLGVFVSSCKLPEENIQGFMGDGSTPIEAPSTVNISASLGYPARTSYRIQGFTNVTDLECIESPSGASISFDTLSGNWVRLKNLTENTTYNITCTSTTQYATVSFRTLAAAEEITPSTGVLDANSNLLGARCLKQGRTLKYNPVNGKLTMFGQGLHGHVGFLSMTCYAEYNNFSWDIVEIPSTDPGDSGSWSRNTPSGIGYDSSGAIYGIESITNGTYKSRLSKCSMNCNNPANWTYVEIPRAWLGHMISTRDFSKLIIIGSGPTNQIEVRICNLTTDCMNLANWSTSAEISGTTLGGYAQMQIIEDSNRGLWIANSNATNPIVGCAANLDCSVATNWVKGKLHASQVNGANLSDARRAVFGELNGKLYYFYNYGSEWISAQCDLTTDCYAVTTGVLSNWNGVRSTGTNFGDYIYGEIANNKFAFIFGNGNQRKCDPASTDCSLISNWTLSSYISGNNHWAGHGGYSAQADDGDIFVPLVGGPSPYLQIKIDSYRP